METPNEFGEIEGQRVFICQHCLALTCCDDLKMKVIRPLTTREGLGQWREPWCELCKSHASDFVLTDLDKLAQKVFLIKDNNANSWSGTTYIYPNVFRSRETARKYIGVVSDYFSDLSKPIEPYFSILEVELS